jgi:hypothetical protein
MNSISFFLVVFEIKNQMNEQKCLEEKTKATKASLQNKTKQKRQLCCWLKNSELHKKELEMKKKKRKCLSTSKKKIQHDKAFIHHIYARGKGARACVFVLSSK